MPALQRAKTDPSSGKPVRRLKPPSVRAVLAAAHQPAASSQLIAVRELAKSYPAKDGSLRALTSVSFSVRAGEFVFITGPTGGGKSTLLRLIGGQLKPDSGSVSLAGLDIRTLDQKLFRRKVGFVSQNFELLDRRTVAENIAFTLEAQQADPRETDKRVQELLDVFDLRHAADRLAGANLSGGEQQRLAIARAIAHRPDLLLCDEPTGNLDRRTTFSVMRMLNRVSMQGTTVLCVTHDDTMVNLMQKRVIVIDGGQVAADQIGGYQL